MLLPLTITRHATLTRHSRVTAVLLHTTNALYQSGTYFIRGRSRVCRQVVRMASADAASADAPTWKERQREAIDAQACSKEAAANGKPKVIIITGPTAVGKSHTALAVAKQLDGEIISADSVQVYRGMNIGADKVRSVAADTTTHHHIASTAASAPAAGHPTPHAGHYGPPRRIFRGTFLRNGHPSSRRHYQCMLACMQSYVVCTTSLQRGKVPILVGGSGLYLRWFMFGKPSTPPATAETVKKADDALEAAFAAAEAAIGRPLKPAEAWQAAAELVASLGDPISAKKLENQPNSWYRMRRVLQILLHTGTPLADQDIKLTSTLRYDVRAFFLSRPRMELYRRIDARCERMLLAGLVEVCFCVCEQLCVYTCTHCTT